MGIVCFLDVSYGTIFSVCVDHFTGWKRNVCVGGGGGGGGGVKFESLLVLLLGVCN